LTSEVDIEMAQLAKMSETSAAVLQRIESEPLEITRLREASTFDTIAGPFSTKLILFGAGALGRSTLAGLRRAKIEPLAFADNNPQLWGTQIDGLAVLPTHEAASRYSQTACFVVTIYNGSSARRQLTASGCKAVAPFASLFWKYADIFIPDSCLELPHRLRSQLNGVTACEAILGDEVSRAELVGQLIWRYWLEDGHLTTPLDPHDTYFPLDLLKRLKDEVFLDCGSFDGQTLQNFISHWKGNFRHAFAFEPDRTNLMALTTNIEALGLRQKVTIFPYAIGNSNRHVPFTSTGSVASHVGGQGCPTLVECKRLDDIQWLFAPTYIKMDIEGAELEALRGASEVLRRYQPVLAVCTYHRGDHLWQIPNLIHSISARYHIFLRRYAEECWEGICYAIPPHRLKTA
jgi:FkbM family methyltransferase